MQLKCVTNVCYCSTETPTAENLLWRLSSAESLGSPNKKWRKNLNEGLILILWFYYNS